MWPRSSSNVGSKGGGEAARSWTFSFFSRLAFGSGVGGGVGGAGVGFTLLGAPFGLPLGFGGTSGSASGAASGVVTGACSYTTLPLPPI